MLTCKTYKPVNHLQPQFCFIWNPSGQYPWPTTISRLCLQHPWLHKQLSVILICWWYTKCLRTISDPADSIQLQDDINSLNHWSEQWSLLFNPTKIVQISFKPNLQTSYTIGTSLITSHKDLGIIVSSNLTWKAYYNQIIAKAYSILGLLNHTRSKKQLYISLVRSQLLYCSTLWKPHFIKHIQPFERVQRWATKYILNYFTSDYKSRMRLLPLTYIYY